MKIFFRYLFIRLLVPFAVTLFACTVIWIMVDLYGNIDDFLVHKINVRVVVYFYLLRIPGMLVQVLPAAVLFSTLWTLLSLNRRCELVAFQSGGMAPIWLFSPFFLFAILWVLVLAYDLSGPAAQSEVARERLLQQVKGQSTQDSLQYVDRMNRLVWYFDHFDLKHGTATGVSIFQFDAQGHDVNQYFAHDAKWVDDHWRLTGVREFIYGPDGSKQDDKTYEVKDLDITTPPKQLSLIVSQPEQLTLPQLSQYIAASTATPEYLAKFRTEWWYRVLHPLSLIVLLLFALLQGMRNDRRSAIMGVVWAIIVLLVYIMMMNIFMTAGRFNRLPPFVAVIATEFIFGSVGLYLLAANNGWWWQLTQLWKQRQARRVKAAG